VLSIEHGGFRPRAWVSAAESKPPPRRGGEDAQPIRVLVGWRAARELRRSIEVDVAGVQLIRAQPRPPGCSNPAAAGRNRPGVERSCGE
jgi:hypothetical protein